MSKLEKLIVRFLSHPNDLTWEELVKILNHFGYQELPRGKTGGSRRKFVDEKKHIVSLHKPHPANIIKKYQIEDVIASLKETGKL